MKWKTSLINRLKITMIMKAKELSWQLNLKEKILSNCRGGMEISQLNLNLSEFERNRDLNTRPRNSM